MKRIIKYIFVMFIFFFSIQFVNAEEIVNDATTNIIYKTHIQDIGWQNNVIGGNISGTTGRRKRIEAITINLNNQEYDGNIEYQSHVQDYGWMNWTSNGNISGTTGQSKRVEAIKIRLTGDIANYYDIYYQVHIENIGWTKWTSNGEIAGSQGYGYRMEAIRIRLVKKEDQFNEQIGTAYYPKQASIKYQSHIQDMGWQNKVKNGNISGTTGYAKRIEAIVINLDKGIYSGNIEYQTHVQDYGWMNWTSNGNISGTTGQSKRVEAIKIRLTGDIASYYDIYYQVHIENIGWTKWTSNGEIAGSQAYGYRMEAIRIRLVKKGDQFNEQIGAAYYPKQASIKYQTHIQSIGWQAKVSNGDMTGTTGQSKRIEAIRINLDKGVYSGNIEYQSHIQDYGWMNWSSNGNISGTTGQSKRVEAIKIRLTGDIANYYDIYYQAHIENIGWTGWNYNGNEVGTTGYGYRMEAIRIKLVKKGDQSPELSESTLYVKPTFNWYYSNNTKVLENTSTGIIGKNVQKIIDISSNNKKIDWNAVKNSDVDGVILRVGYGSIYEDKNFAFNLSEVNRLGIPYGIYLFSYAENNQEALLESNFLINEIRKYNLNPILGIYYDIESWNIDDYIPNISADTYDEIITTFINNMSANGYSSSVYTYLNYTKYNLNPDVLQYVAWIAQYSNSCSYQNTYKMWQYTSDGSVPGINGRVDINVRFN